VTRLPSENRKFDDRVANSRARREKQNPKGVGRSKDLYLTRTGEMMHENSIQSYQAGSVSGNSPADNENRVAGTADHVGRGILRGNSSGHLDEATITNYSVSEDTLYGGGDGQFQENSLTQREMYLDEPDFTTDAAQAGWVEDTFNTKAAHNNLVQSHNNLAGNHNSLVNSHNNLANQVSNHLSGNQHHFHQAGVHSMIAGVIFVLATVSVQADPIFGWSMFALGALTVVGTLLIKAGVVSGYGMGHSHDGPPLEFEPVPQFESRAHEDAGDEKGADGGT
jgi:hypothetical protein